MEYISALQEQLGQTGQELSRERDSATSELRQKAEQLAQAQALIAELKRELFGAKADKLNAEQEQQLRQLIGDVQEQNQRPPPLSRELVEETVAQERAEQRQRAKERRRRHLPPVELEKQQVILEPPDKLCPQSGEPRARIGQEVTTEYDYLPAKLIIRETRAPQVWPLRQALLPGGKHCPAATATGAPKQAGAGPGGLPAVEPL